MQRKGSVDLDRIRAQRQTGGPGFQIAGQWSTQPPGTKSWRLTIRTQRQELVALRESTPRFTQRFIEERYWQRCVQEARDNAEEEMGLPVTCNNLTWEEVFEQRYDERLSTS